MPVVTPKPRILIKGAPGLAEARLTFGAVKVPYTAKPLFESVGRPTALGVSAPPQWHVLTPTAETDEANAWDLCHALLRDGLGITGAATPEFAEPDIAQRWVVGDIDSQVLRMGSACAAEPATPDFPNGATPLWFRDAGHGDFDPPLNDIGDPSGLDRVRIAHLDTGYDPQYKDSTNPSRRRPPHLDLARQRNFVDDNNKPDDASDNTEGLLTNLGHGTGTLGILAGPRIGGAPFAEIVPVRVANRVVLFYNSAIARALDYVHSLCRSDHWIDVITMSMGGLASAAWADAVNALYDLGVFIVTASGNNFGNLPTRHVVYPARFRRVLAACGVMADHSAYADLGLERMAGNYGPPSKMNTAMAAYTPNVPWPKIGCPDTVDLDGAGTSAATPQIAAAAAVWIQLQKAQLAGLQGWQRIEAVRRALREGVQPPARADKAHTGWGELGVSRTAKRPLDLAGLAPQPPDDVSFPFLRTLTGLGFQAQPDARQRILELEALQLSQSAEVEALLPEPDTDASSLPAGEVRRIVDALAANPAASEELRSALGAGARRIRTIAPPIRVSGAVEKLHLKHATDPEIAEPPMRRLRVYAYDPSLETRIETAGINQATLQVRWERDLQPGPVGEYLEVVDVDPASRCCYAPVDLNHPNLVAQDGLVPSVSNPQFHQQMAYAVAMTTIEHFERALGRVALWSARPVTVADQCDERYVQRLRIYPHALRAANAYYSPDKKALLLGYFNAAKSNSGDVRPEGIVFSALSLISSHTRRRTLCSTVSTGASASRRIPTCWHSTRLSPTSSRCSSISRCPRRCCTRSSPFAATS
jgi:hypothetical protein